MLLTDARRPARVDARGEYVALERQDRSRWDGKRIAEGIAALQSGALAQLDSSFRADIDHQLQDAPVARGVLGTLIAATALSVLLAVIGLLTTLLGGTRDERVESDLEEQGDGPRECEKRLLELSEFNRLKFN